MPSQRIWPWVALSLALAAAAGTLAAGRLLLHSLAPLPEDHLQRALHVLAYQRVPCPQATLADYAEGSVTVQCRDQDATQYTVFAQEHCSETWECRWFWILCMHISKRQPRLDAPT
jgi:hypothetical protein